MKGVWSAIHAGKQEDAKTAIQQRVVRQYTMLATALVWNWLDQECALLFREILSGKLPAGIEWLRDLMGTVKRFYTVSLVG